MVGGSTKLIDPAYKKIIDQWNIHQALYDTTSVTL
jgi:hypothetical protein